MGERFSKWPLVLLVLAACGTEDVEVPPCQSLTFAACRADIYCAGLDGIVVSLPVCESTLSKECNDERLSTDDALAARACYRELLNQSLSLPTICRGGNSTPVCRQVAARTAFKRLFDSLTKFSP